MRTIKFRAWDEGNNIMHYDFEFIRSGDDSGEGSDWIIFKSDKQRLEDSKVFDNPYFNLQLELMQYTGLKDKNGVEIYDGDILSNSFMDSFPNKKSVVVWKNFKWMLKISSAIRPLSDNCGWCSINEIRYGGVEVIGNIYENEDLL